MKIFELSNQELADKIRRGKQWLRTHRPDQETTDQAQYQRALEGYQALLEAFKFRGLSESLILDDDELIGKEKHEREMLSGHNTHSFSYIADYKEWFALREECVRRKLVSFFIPPSERVKKVDPPKP